MPLELNGDYGAVLGLEIRSNRCHAALLNLRYDRLFSKTINYQTIEGNFLETFFNILDSLKEDIEASPLPLIGIGIAVPADVNPYSGKIKKSHSLGLENYEFGKLVASQMKVPVCIDNDANCGAWRELVYPARSCSENFIYCHVKFKTEDSEEHKGRNVIGIGIGIAAAGKVYYGETFSAGEFKSVLWRQGNKELVDIPSSELVGIKRDPEVRRKLIREFFWNLSVVASVLNLGEIFTGGDLAEYYDEVIDVIETELAGTFIASQHGCKITASENSPDFIASGAACMFIERMFEIPEIGRSHHPLAGSWSPILKQD